MKETRNYIFTFGNIGSGKSTFIAVALTYLANNVAIYYNPNQEEGADFAYTLLDRIDKYSFPNASVPGDVTEIDMWVEYTNHKEVSRQRFTFLEMAGADLIDIYKKEKDDFKKKIDRYLHISKAIIVITDVNKAKQDDMLLHRFLGYLESRKLGHIPIILLINKWDEVLPSDDDYKVFCERYLPLTINMLKATNFEQPRVFTFSIGEVHNNKIIKLEYSNVKEILQWILTRI